ncbi:thermonuclease family protein [Weizmannia acidilactici]|uniref:thermonuclease family protein n=1 Tax=Weizmannia acidilactici TaxID=2607726 RepID=UPI00124F7017|nr:thermonuclease family protein [Weizmannia acidilactici]GER66742.1 hypothetical protein BpJC4_12130 [Weizmannia acidilactici]GER73797.1 hypothetical protein BpPP18_18640 [Weizmannia acidilactici]
MKKAGFGCLGFFVVLAVIAVVINAVKFLFSHINGFFLAFAFLSLLFAFLSFFFPRLGFWAKKKTKFSSSTGYFILAIIFFILFGITAPTQDTTHQKSDYQTAATKAKNTAGKSGSNPKEDKSKPAEAAVPAVKKHKKISTPSNQHAATLVETVDGDTIKVIYKGKEKTVRYLLVDTPEEKKPGTCVQPYAVSAYNKNKQLVNSGKLTLEFETNGDTRDKYGRLLAYVYVNGKSVQEELLKDGYARVAYIYHPPYKYLSKYEKDEKIAENKHLHIWSQKGYATDSGFNGCSKSTAAAKSSSAKQSGTGGAGSSSAYQNNPADDQESNMVCKGKIKGNANSKIYHLPGNPYYNRTKDNIVWFCTEAQAKKAGYRPSK